MVAPLRPLRPEASTVSLPPRERRLAKARAKAIRHSQPIPRPNTKPKTRPTPTLAATRQRRSAAMDVTYLNRADGFHIKRVVRREATPAHAPPVPYLPGQEDIPRSDEESDYGTDNRTNDGTDNGTIATVLEAGLPMNMSDIGISTDINNRAVPAELEEVDYDAEGEDDDEVMEDRAGLAAYTFDAAWDHSQPTSTSQAWPRSSAQPEDLISSASDEDIQALFQGLDNFPANFGNDFPAGSTTGFTSGFPTANAATGTLGVDVQGTFQLPALADHWQPFSTPRQHSHDESLHFPTQPPVFVDHPHPAFAHHLPPITPSRAPTPRSAVRPTSSVSSPFAHPSLPPHRATQPASHAGAPFGVPSLSRSSTPASQAPSSRTRDLVAQARSQVRPAALILSRPLPVPGVGVPAGPLLRRLPLRRSLELPSFLGGSEDETPLSDEDQRRSPTPVAFDDTDIGLDEYSPMPVTQARARAVRYHNVELLPRHAASNPTRIPTVWEVQTNASKVFRLSRQRTCKRRATTAESACTRNTLSSAELTPDQQAVILYMEYRVMRGVLWDTAWPDPEERAKSLLDAQDFALEYVKVSDEAEVVFTPQLLATVFYRVPGNRGGSLAKIQYMMEEKFKIQLGNKWIIYQLMDKDLYLYPSVERKPGEYFCVEALGAVLEIILFRSSKQVGLAFMEDMCKPDDAERCAHWHRKLRDQTARKGVPPGLLAFAATQMYWALERLYMGTKLNFDEQHYRAVWDRYFHALIKLPHLGRLRVDMLDRLKEYYMVHWPAGELDEDDDSLPAW